MKRTTLFILASLGVALNIHAQHDDTLGFPKIGKPCPAFVLNDVLDFSATTVTQETFKGKWLIMAFWSTGCSASISNFPVLQQWHDKFSDRLAVVAIGKQTPQGSAFYDKLKRRYGLHLPVTFDTELRHRFGIDFFPHFMVVDPAGIVRAITYRLQTADVETLLSAGEVNLPVKPNVIEREQLKEFDLHAPLLINGNGGEETDFLQRSILVPWKKSMSSATYDYLDMTAIINNRFQVVGADLEWLYRLAYGDTIFSMPIAYNEPTTYGTLSRKLILEVADTTPFKGDYITANGVYAYSLSIPPGKVKNTRELQQLMQRDLKNFFGYEVSVEYRTMPCWKLVATDQARAALRTQGGKPVDRYDLDKVVLQNQPMYMLIPALWMADQFGPPVIDETNIRGNVDITLEAFITDREDVQQGLKKLGLKLVAGKKKMKVIVIRDGAANPR